MHPLTGLAIYFVLWWLVLFTVLPWGLRQPETPELGHMHGAPDNPQLGKKALWTTAITTVIFGIVYAVIESNLIS